MESIQETTSWATDNMRLSRVDWSGVVLGVLRSVSFTKRIKHTWKVVKGMFSFNSDLIYDSELYTEKYATGRTSSPIWYTWNVHCIFAVWSYMFKNWCFKINYCLNILLIIRLIYQREGWQAIEFYAQFRIIFILIRCVFLSPVRRYLQIFLGFYKANREIRNNRFVYKFCLPIGDCIVNVGT